MKKKLAFLLAAIMVITSLPGMTLMASSNNRISRTISTEANTLWLEYGMPVPAGDFTLPAVGARDIERAQSGANLLIELNHNVPAGAQFTVDLEGAAWYFRQEHRAAAAPGTPGGNFWATTTGPQIEVDIDDMEVEFTLTFAHNQFSVLEFPGADGTIFPLMPTGHSLNLLTQGVFNLDDSDPDFFDEVEATVAIEGTGVAADAPLDTDTFPQLDLTPAVLGPVAVGYVAVGVNSLDALGALAQVLRPIVANPLFDWDSIAIVGTDLVLTAVVDLADFAAVEYVTVNTTRITGTEGAAGTPPQAFFPRFYGPHTAAQAAGYPEGFAGGGVNWGAVRPNFVNAGLVRPLDTFIWEAATAPSDGNRSIAAGSRHVTFNPATQVTTFHNTTGYPGNIPYILEIVGGAWQTRATITLMAPSDVNAAPTVTGEARYDVIGIPLIMRTTRNDDIRVRVAAGFQQIANTTHVIGTHADGRVNIAFDTVTFRHHEIIVGRTRLTEQRAGSIPAGRWEFEMTAPSGYEWVLPDNLFVLLDSTLAWQNDGAIGQRQAARVASGLAANELPTNQITFRYNQRGQAVDRSRILVNVPANTIRPSTQGTGGTMWLLEYNATNQLRLVPENYDSFSDNDRLYVNFRNTHNNVLPSTRVFLATARDFGITLTRVADQGRTNAIPELISGRLEHDIRVLGTHNWQGGAYDDYHRAATVRFAETVSDSWWAMRNTVFTLPEGVRFLEVEIYDSRALVSNAASIGLHQGTNQATGNSRNPEPFFNTGLRRGSVTVNHETLTLHGLSVNPNGIGRFDMRIWLNIQVDFEGEILMTLANSAFRQVPDNYEASIVIAYAVSPITVETEVTEARVGFQFVSVADFSITENVAGALLQGEDVYITITDQIAVDMAIAPGFTQAVTDGNIRISNARTNTLLGWTGVGMGANQRGQLQFTIERASTIASTIEFTNVQVRIDRTVPFSNLSLVDTQGYDIHVWGRAVANNFRGLYGPSNDAPFVTTTGGARNERDLFPVGSISAQYVLIETPGEFAQGGDFGRYVRVPVPSSVVTVDGIERTLPVATWICPVSSSAMVPIRFISYALGLSEDAVMWDPETSTVTVDAGVRVVQFQTGNSFYVVNGVPIRMTNAAGAPVEMQIRYERSFVPFRALGNAFNIPVEWCADTATAIYNPR